MNNYEKIKNMSLDEMAVFIRCSDCYYCSAKTYCNIWKEDEPHLEELCDKYAKQWLLSESEG